MEDSNLNLSVVSSLVYCESDTLDHVVTEADSHTDRLQVQQAFRPEEARLQQPTGQGYPPPRQFTYSKTSKAGSSPMLDKKLTIWELSFTMEGRAKVSDEKQVSKRNKNVIESEIDRLLNSVRGKECVIECKKEYQVLQNQTPKPIQREQCTAGSLRIHGDQDIEKTALVSSATIQTHLHLVTLLPMQLSRARVKATT
uniref:(California timema) hypothetical protein n=1 Tax=Timema californicum TaxID=61474 RepID=A0A7R9J7Y1_TIMCA|nr:unnamed protein product [Timema californicum]